MQLLAVFLLKFRCRGMVEVLCQEEGLLLIWKPAGVPLETPKDDGGLALELRNCDCSISDGRTYLLGPRLIRGVEGPVAAASSKVFQAYVEQGGSLCGTATLSDFGALLSHSRNFIFLLICLAPVLHVQL